MIQSRSFEELKPQVLYCKTELLKLQFETESIISLINITISGTTK
jgi:hypothetical protein